MQVPCLSPCFSPTAPLRTAVCHGGSDASALCRSVPLSLRPFLRSLGHSANVHCGPSPAPTPPPKVWASGLGLQHSSASADVLLPYPASLQAAAGEQLGCHLRLEGSWHLGQTSSSCLCQCVSVCQDTSITALAPQPPLPPPASCTAPHPPPPRSEGLVPLGKNSHMAPSMAVPPAAWG